MAAERASPAAGAVGLTPGEPSGLLAGAATGELVGVVPASPRTPIDWTIAKDAAARKKRQVIIRAQVAGLPQVGNVVTVDLDAGFSGLRAAYRV